MLHITVIRSISLKSFSANYFTVLYVAVYNRIFLSNVCHSFHAIKRFSVGEFSALSVSRVDTASLTGSYELHYVRTICLQVAKTGTEKMTEANPMLTG